MHQHAELKSIDLSLQNCKITNSMKNHKLKWVVQWQ